MVAEQVSDSGEHAGSRWDIRIRDGLVDAKHRAAMGPAVWLYLYLHAHAGFETGVLPHYRHADAAAELGLSERTVERHMARLRRGGYVLLTQRQHSAHIGITRYKAAPRGQANARKAPPRPMRETPGAPHKVSTLADPDPATVSTLDFEGRQSGRSGSTVQAADSIQTFITHRTMGAACVEIPTPAGAPAAAHTLPAPSALDHAVETITAAIIVARESTVAVERTAGRLAALQAAVRQHIVAPLAGDPRQITAAQVVRCVAYLRSKEHITPRMVTARTVADELGPWRAAGQPDRWEPPPQATRQAPRRADLPAPLYGDGPHHAIICYCGKIEGSPHIRRTCRMTGLVAPDNYRDMHNVNWITTPEGEFEEYDIREEPGTRASAAGPRPPDGSGQQLHGQGWAGDRHHAVSLVQ